MEKMDGSEELVQNNADKRIQRINQNEEIDAKYGFLRHRSPNERIGWLINFQPVRDILFFF
jgi:hypothetical protein